MLQQFSQKIANMLQNTRSFFPLLRLMELLVFGGRKREAFLVYMLGKLHRSQFRRDWIFCTAHQPHFYNQRWNGFSFTYGDSRNPYTFFRGFFACEVIDYGDSILDIGCGDGFFTNSFFSLKCKHIDAIDIDESAINAARVYNSNSKIEFSVLDAVTDEFPSKNYEVIVWDGAIGHFDKNDINIVLKKIHNSLTFDGVFVGSESLGVEGSDHLQYFDSENDLALLFKPYFKYVTIKTVQYNISENYIRREAYWRCTNRNSARFEKSNWCNYSDVQ